MTSKTCSDGFGYIYRKALTVPLIIMALPTVLTIFTGIGFVGINSPELISNLISLLEIVFANPFGDAAFLILCCLAAAALFVPFHFVSRSSVLLSAGISRPRQFLARWLAGLTAVGLACAVQDIFVLIDYVRTGTYAYGKKELFFTFAVFALCYILAYTIAAFCFANSCNAVSGVIWTGVFGLAVYNLSVIANAAERLRFGSPYVAEDMCRYFGADHPYHFLNPFSGAYNVAAELSGRHYGFDRTNVISVPLLIASFALVALFFFLGIYGFRNRSAENCGRFFRSYFVYRVASFFAGAVLFSIIVTYGTGSVLSAVAGAAAAVLIILLVNSAISRKPFIVGASVAAAVLAALCVSSFLRPYTPPETTEGVDYMSICSGRMQVFNDSFAVGYSDAFALQYYTPYFELPTSGPEEISTVHGIHKAIHDAGCRDEKSGAAQDFPVFVTYYMKDGTEKEYYYRYVPDEVLGDLCALEKTDAAMEELLIPGAYFATVMDKNMNVTGIITDAQGLLSAVRTDILARDSRFAFDHKPEDEIAVLSFDDGTDRIFCAAGLMWTDMTDAEKEKFAGFDAFLHYYVSMTEGSVCEDTDGDGWFEEQFYWGDFGLEYYETADGGEDNRFYVSDPDAPGVVRKAAEYYRKAGELSGGDMVELMLDFGQTVREKGILVVTSDMKNTVEFLKRSQPVPAEEGTEVISAIIVPFDIISEYHFENDITGAVSRNVSSYDSGVVYNDVTYYRMLENAGAQTVTDAQAMAVLLENSTLTAPLITKNTNIVIFTRENGSRFSKFIPAAQGK